MISSVTNAYRYKETYSTGNVSYCYISEYYPRRCYTAAAAAAASRLPQTNMPALVLSPQTHLGNSYPTPYHHQGLYNHSIQHPTAVPSGYNPNSVHQYPRQPSPQDSQTKPLRPAERMRLRPWLIKMIEERKIPGLEWEDREQQTVKIPWKHAARHGWVKDRDASLFKAWAIHTKKYNPATDTPKANPKMWKANFRCAINSLPDIEELRDRGKTKGNDAYKVYRLIPRTKGAAKLKSADSSRSKKPRKPKMTPVKPIKTPTVDTKPIVTDQTSPSISHRLHEDIQQVKPKVELTVSTNENPFQSPLASPTSVTSSQPTTPHSAPPMNIYKASQQWLYDQCYMYQQNLEPYQNGIPDTEDYMSDASGSNLTDEEIVDMVDEMIKDSPINSPTNTVPSSPLDYDGNNNPLGWADPEGRIHYAHPLTAAHHLNASHLTSSLAPYLTAEYHSPQIGVVKVEPQSEDCSSPSVGYPRAAPPSYHDAVAGRAECIKDEPSPTYHTL